MSLVNKSPETDTCINPIRLSYLTINLKPTNHNSITVLPTEKLNEIYQNRF